LLVNVTKGMNEDEIITHLKKHHFVDTLLPKELSLEICKLCGVDIETKFSKLDGKTKNKLVKYLAWTPLL